MIATSKDFFEIVRLNPVLSVDVFKDFRVDNSLRESTVSLSCPFARILPLPMGSAFLPWTTMGDDCLLGKAVELVVSVFPFKVRAAPGLDLPADGGPSSKVLCRFGGVSSGKSGGTIGCDCGRTRRPGELGRETEARFCLARVRPSEAEGPFTGDIDSPGFRRVGVVGLDVDRLPIEFKFAETCGLEIGVEGLEF